MRKPIPSPVVLGQVTERFREAVKELAEREQIPIYQFRHKERKDDVANQIRQQRGVRDAIVFVGVAQEKTQAFSGKKIHGQFEFTRDKTVYVNHYYFYIDDQDFGPLFIKVCSYAPWGMKLCLNGHEWVKRQLDQRRISYEALDNGLLSCAEPKKLQEICDSLGPEEIDRVFRKWLKRIPLPLREPDRRAGYDWDLSIWQMEVSLTQIFDRPLRGREFFEEIMISERTVSRILRTLRRPPTQTWKTFLHNHLGQVVSIDFFTVPTVTMRVLFVFIVLEHRSREVLHFNVTEHPTAAWTAQQIVEAFADRDAPRYLIRDRDSVYGNEVRLRIASLHIEELLTAPRSPWQNPYAERLIGSIRRDCLNHFVILSARHLKRTLASYFAYYHGSRTHLGLDKQCPFPRQVSSVGKIIEIPQLGGLHHRYERVAA